MERPSNLVVIESLKREDICQRVMAQKGGVHVTNGTYMLPPEKIVAKQLGAFQLIRDRFADERDVFLIAVNSDASMRNIMEEKRAKAGAAVAEGFEPQMTRAEKVAVPVALQHPDRKVFVAFYDESTPTALYNLFKAKGADLATIYKWGYGLTQNGPGIEG